MVYSWTNCLHNYNDVCRLDNFLFNLPMLQLQQLHSPYLFFMNCFFLLFEPENSFIINEYLIVLFLLQICGSGGHSAYSEEIITLFINKAGCDGRPGSQLGEDLCGVCGGYNDCEDCSGKLNGGMISESEKKSPFSDLPSSALFLHMLTDHILV